MSYDFDIFANNKLPVSAVDFLTYLETIKINLKTLLMHIERI
ncbi:hypothetical protein BJV43_002523 [Clostridium saccharoperbutylacetonicum]|nr:hypothetical protein [Clostridium saccharoperbutylacetonicum]